MTHEQAEPETVEEFLAAAHAWLCTQANELDVADQWGIGDDSVAVFENWTPQEERRRTDAIRDWERRKADARWGAVSWPVEYGGRALPRFYEQIFAEQEARFDVPRRTELFGVTQQLIAPTVAHWGTAEQRTRWIRALLRTDLLACQLFSEPEAGSDLAAVSTRAVPDGDGWAISGQKVWTSGATVADWGEAICRTDPTSSKHAGLTAFMIRLDAPGVTVRPIKQMTGGTSFNEVFLDEVQVPDADRLGPPGSGWQVALTTLAAERLDSGSLGLHTVDRVLALARNLGRPLTEVEADRVADLFVRSLCQRALGLRVRSALVSGRPPGPEASVGKLFATESMRLTSDTVLELLGPRLIADTGEWGTYSWTEHLLGAPGYRIAGGSDEIQRTIIAERILGMAKDPVR